MKSHTPSLFSRCLALVLALGIACAPAHAQLPALGSGGDLSLAQERKMGEQVARELYRDPDYLEDAVLDEYVRGIWTRLLDAARRRGDLADLDDRFAWQVLLGKDREINAFALPGGWMGMNLGLISATTSADEVAAVLGHELSHVTQRHISRMMTEQSKQMPLIIAAMILGAIAASKNADAGNAAIVGGQALAAQTQLNFSRDMEREADRIGFGVMTEAGYDPQAFASMFEKLQHSMRLNDSGAFPYLRTHPLTTERIAEVKARTQLAEAAPPHGPDMVHLMMAGRAKVMSEPGVDTLRSYVVDPAIRNEGNRAREAGAVYAAALAQMKLRDTKAAQALAHRLLELTAGNPEAARQAKLLVAEIALASGDPKPAEALADAKRRPELILSAQARIRDGQAASAAEDLQTWVAVHPKDSLAWQTLSQANTALGQTLRAIRADAETQAAHLDWQAALDRLRAAQDYSRRSGAAARDHIEASIIDARAREVTSLLREQALQR